MSSGCPARSSCRARRRPPRRRGGTPRSRRWGAGPRPPAPLRVGTLRPPLDRAGGGAARDELRPRARWLRPRRGPRRQGDRRAPRVRPPGGERGGALAPRARGCGRAQHPAPGARGARRGLDPAPGRDRRGRETGPLVRGCQGSGVRERRARRRRAGVGRAVRLLVVNWNDRENPHAGGAEIHLHEIFGRLARAGGGSRHAIDLVTSGWPGYAPAAELDGMRVHRVGGRHSFALLARGAVRSLLAARRYDAVVEDINKLPLYLPLLTRLPLYAIVPHLFGTIAYSGSRVSSGR